MRSERWIAWRTCGCGSRTASRRSPGDITIVVHTHPMLLAMAHPFLPAARWSAAPAGRRYLAGWAMATELHVLNDPST